MHGFISGNVNQVELNAKFRAVNNNIVNLKEAEGTFFSYVSYVPPNIGHILNIIIYGIPFYIYIYIYSYTVSCLPQNCVNRMVLQIALPRYMK